MMKEQINKDFMIQVQKIQEQHLHMVDMVSGLSDKFKVIAEGSFPNLENDI